MISIDQALRAQRALRGAAGLEEETFPLPAFIGMISDEVEVLRKGGHDDSDIVRLIEQSSGIVVSVGELHEHYATPEERHRKS